MTKTFPKGAVVCEDGKSYFLDGKYYPDQTPIEMPVGYHHPPDLKDLIAQMVQDDRFRNNPEIDSEEEANDFDVADEGDLPASRHEYTEMDEEYVKSKVAEKEAEVERMRAEVNQLQPTAGTRPRRGKKGKQVSSEEEDAGDGEE